MTGDVVTARRLLEKGTNPNKIAQASFATALNLLFGVVACLTLLFVSFVGTFDYFAIFLLLICLFVYHYLVCYL